MFVTFIDFFISHKSTLTTVEILVLSSWIPASKEFCFYFLFRKRSFFKMKPLIDGFFTDTTNLRIKFLFHAETLYSSSILKFCYAFTTSKYLIYNGKNFFSKKNYYIQTRIAHSWLIYHNQV